MESPRISSMESGRAFSRSTLSPVWTIFKGILLFYVPSRFLQTCWYAYLIRRILQSDPEQFSYRATVHAAIRPAGVGPANGEHELTFAWADRLDSAAGDALAARFLVNPEMDPPFAVVLTIRTDHGLVHSTMTGFRTVPAGFERIDAFLDANNHRPAAGFTVGFPRYATDDPTILRIAHLVAAEASKRLWRFDRDAFRH